MLTNKRILASLFVAASLASPVLAQDSGSNGGSQPFKLGAETNQYLPPDPQGYTGYPAPQMIPQTPKPAHVPKSQPMKLHAEQNQQPTPPPPQRPPMQAQVQASPPPGVMPQQFMGSWSVQGQRRSVQGANAQYQEGYERVFGVNTHNTWTISGRPGAYSISSDGGMQAIQLGQITGTTAFFRYEHPVYMRQENGEMRAMPTNAQEAVVMQLSPDGHSFQGMVRISVVKPGEPGPRGKVQYQLMGRR